MRRSLLALAILLGILSPSSAPRPLEGEPSTAFEKALRQATESLRVGENARARGHIQRALERDPKSLDAWQALEEWARAVKDADALAYALHQQIRLAVAQHLPPDAREAIQERLRAADPIAPDLQDMKTVFVKRLLPIAAFYEKKDRPHSAIRAYREILALDPEQTAAEEAIERISALPDPSLAETAKQKDLLEGVSEEWIRKHDRRHAEWKNRSSIKRPNYVTESSAGYEVMVRAAEAMEQMNAFYRRFFQYGTPQDGRKVPRIHLYIMRDHEEYLHNGASKPEWSGGVFTGSTVETYTGDRGFEGMVGTLFHEASHQFVSLATSATGWLNEGIASFFEGTRILANGTVQMNLPATHRLFPLAARMERGWMRDEKDGTDSAEPNTVPPTAPTFRILLENKYVWGPAWYAPTWGVVYFLYNYQDPFDGRFIYRKAFREFIDSSGGRSGEGAVENFEKIVLAHPAPPTPGLDFSKAKETVKLPATIDEVDAVWKEWILRLRDEQSGRIEIEKPYFAWAKNAIARGDTDDALEFFEKGLVGHPHDVDLLLAFARLLALHYDNTDRASKLLLQAIRVLEFAEPRDDRRIHDVEQLLARWDPMYREISGVHEELWATARGLAQRYLAADLPRMAMDISWRLGTELSVPDIFQYYEEAVRRTGESPWIWKLAYNEKDLDGWVPPPADTAFRARGEFVESSFGTFDPNRFDYQFLTLDTVTSGDFSFEVQIEALGNQNLFCGIVFGKKSDTAFHAVIYFPGTPAAEGSDTAGRSAFVDLASFYGGSDFKTWRHNPVETTPEGGTTTGDWHRLRIDVTGRLADVWFDDKLIVTHEFASLDVLRGGMGLITGPGTARFRDIRYLSRPPGDRAAAVEREVRLERFGASETAGGGTAGIGSFLGQVPPFPQHVTWVQGSRASWQEKGLVPTVLALWSRRQNDQLPIDAWLRDLAARHEDIGLQVVSVAAFDDEEDLPEYLATHAFPGAVAADQLLVKGAGDTFDTYAVVRFSLPRILLLDVDQKVVWEGDPGFRLSEPWQPGMESYVDSPLADLIERRKLRETIRWRKAWNGGGQEALRAGDLATAGPLLLVARELDGSVFEDVRRAQLALETLESSLDALTVVARNLQRNEREPAMNTLFTWAETIDRPLESAAKKAFLSVLRSPRARSWTQILNAAKRARRAFRPGKEAAAVDGVLAILEAHEGPFARELEADLTRARDAGDWEAAHRALEEVEARPASWLAAHYFKW